MRTYTDAIEILVMNKGRAKPGIIFVMVCYTKLFCNMDLYKLFYLIYAPFLSQIEEKN